MNIRASAPKHGPAQRPWSPSSSSCYSSQRPLVPFHQLSGSYPCCCVCEITKESVWCFVHRVIRTEKPSSHWPHEPETPQMVYPRGGIKVCLYHVLVLKDQWQQGTYESPPFALPYTGDFRPRLVRIWMPSIQKPDRTTKPLMYSPRRTSKGFG